VRPGAIDYLFSPGDSLEALVARLEDNDWWGQIIGPHGSGKSTLLAHVPPALERRGRRWLHIALHDGQRSLPRDFAPETSLDAATVVIVDGYEQLSRLHRFRLKRMCRRRGCGLLVTAHTAVGLSTLVETGTSLESALRVIDKLVPADERAIDPQAVARSLAVHDGNLREVLFDLYDLYQRQMMQKRSGDRDGGGSGG
jgi:energy-coupling factor transporter ATP-binding protein EcfA2